MKKFYVYDEPENEELGVRPYWSMGSLIAALVVVFVLSLFAYAVCRADVTTGTVAYALYAGNANKVSLKTVGTVPIGIACTSQQITASGTTVNIITDRNAATVSGSRPLQVWAICGEAPTPKPPTSVTLSWVPPTQNTDNTPLTNLAGYRVLYGTSASSLTQTIDIPKLVSTYVVDGLAPGTWYFTVRAYTSAGSESANSNIVSKTL